MTTQPEFRLRRNTVLLLAAAAAIIIIGQVALLFRFRLYAYISFVTVEDAFYYIVPAMQFHHTGVLGLDGRHITNGFHPLWMLINVLVAGLFANKFTVMHIISALGLAFALAGFILVARQEGRTRRGMMVMALVFSALFCSPLFLYWLNAMETGLAFFALCLLYCYSYALRDTTISGRQAFTFGIIAGICCLARLDFFSLVVALGLVVFFALLRAPASKGRWRCPVTFVLYAGAGLLLLLLPYLLWTRLAVGTFIPISALVKAYYAHYLARPGFLFFVHNVVGYFTNCERLFFGAVNAHKLWFLPVTVGMVVVMACGAVSFRRHHSTEHSIGSIVRQTFVFIPILHAVLYAFQLGSFANNSYINWYYSPELLVCSLLFGYGITALLRRVTHSSAWQIAGLLLLCLCIAGRGARHYRELLVRTDLASLCVPHFSSMPIPRR